ncbi:MAG: SGNH/GDSL hydrolase family protein [Planctomycetota bacterium]|jgi:lysophospholipase L1-like esterase
MKHQQVIRSLLLALVLLPLARVTSAQEQAPPASPLKTLELSAGDSIVFLGDSITHQCLYTQYVEDYFYTRFPKRRLKIHNAGVGGARAWDALARFDDDVAAYKPKYVTILLGMNDGTYRPFHQETFDTYHADMTELIGRLNDIGATPILMTPTMYDSRAARLFARPGRKAPEERLNFYNSVLTYYGTWLREVAVDNGFGFVDMWGPLNNITLAERKNDPKFTLIRDAVHPDAPGQVVMAVAIINDMALPKQLSNIRITRKADGSTVSQGIGGQFSEDVEWTDDGVKFTWLADGLPWVVPEEARLGAKLTKLGHRHSREALEVHGLTSGRYELSIDGTVVGTYSADALERHIELQENAKTPQYQQALAVANLNKERNAGAVRSLRGEWSRFQRYAREKRDAASDEDRQKVEAKYPDMGAINERVAVHNAAAREIEDRIFKINQPQARQYELKRVVVRPKQAAGN